MTSPPETTADPTEGAEAGDQTGPGTSSVVPDETGQRPTPDWFKTAVFYEVLVRSFNDSNGNGTGDFKGLADKGVEVVLVVARGEPRVDDAPRAGAGIGRWAVTAARAGASHLAGAVACAGASPLVGAVDRARASPTIPFFVPRLAASPTCFPQS